MDIVGNIMPAAKKIDAKICVQSFNAVLEVSLWTFAQLFVCWSISAHLLMFAMFVSVIMLWVRRRGMKPADEASDSSSEESESKDGAPPVSSRQRQSLGSAGTHDVSSSSSSNSSNTIEYKSKAYEPQRSHNSSSSSSSSDNDWNGHNNGGDTFVF